MSKERPILFSGAMVRALLDGSKSQTRRIITGPKHGLKVNAHPTEPAIIATRVDEQWDGFVFSGGMCRVGPVQCPYGQPGDRLWVRETWAQNWNQLSDTRMDRSYAYRADGDERAQDNGTDLPWRPSIHMPRAASRILLEIVSVRVERLQDVSEADARAEGATHYEPANYLSHGGWSHDGYYVHATARASYERLWNDIKGAGSWDANPFVWVIEFKRVAP